MNRVVYILLFVLLGMALPAIAQKPFDEGIIRYHAVFKSLNPLKDTKSYDGTYTYTIKGKMVRKELKLDNGYNDIVIMNGNNNTLYTLQTTGGKKYAIQHDMEVHLARQKKFEGFTVKDDGEKKTIGGYDAQKAVVTYTDGTTKTIYYSKQWQPVFEHTFDRLPGANFIPLEFDVTEDRQEVLIHFTIEKIELTPVENAAFRIPADYKMVSNEEYKELNK